MPLNKYAVDFDATVSTEEDRIGSYIIGLGGAVVTSTTVGGDEGLDVNIVGSTGLGVYAEDSAAVSGDLGQFILLVRQDTLAVSTSNDGDYGAFKSSNLGELYTKDSSANTTLTAILADTATIDSQTLLLSTLVKAEDAAAADGGAGLAAFSRRQDSPTTDTSTDGDYSYLKSDSVGRLWTQSLVFSNVADDAVASENGIPVAGVARSTATALSALSASGDKSNLLMDLYRRVFVRDSADVAWKVSAETVTTTPAELVSAPLVGRKKVLIQNQSGGKIWVKNNNTVAADNTSVEITPNSSLEFEFGEAMDLWAVASSGSRLIAVMEAA